MLINEIEVTGSSFSFKRFVFRVEEKIKDLFDGLMKKCDMFSVETELPGLHDCDCNENVIRGFYSMVIPFEVEHLVDGMTTKTLFKRIESCEFIITENICIMFGESGPIKCLGASLSAATGCHIDLAEFEFQQLNNFQERMTKIASVALVNPKEKEIRKAKLSGHIESYAEYNIIDPRNHGIDSVKGVIDTPLGPMSVKASKKGSITLSVRKGMILNTECVEWILRLIENETAPAMPETQKSLF